ncbi:MAG: hypothetical protein NTW29_02045 [Bacteroidetes bacterium]|nr:hypothetical protein [Bacteroidota bacterium]
MLYRPLFSCCVFISILIGCSNNSQNERSNNEKKVSKEVQTIIDPNVIKVYVEEDGTITADGYKITLNGLDSSFSQLKVKTGTVYYSRANTASDPPQESMQVMDLIAKYSLSVKLFTDKTFTVVFTPN